MRRFFSKKRRIVMILIWAAILALRTTAWLCAPFCDWYVAHVLPIWLNTYGRLSGLFPVSIGEWMLYLAALLVFIALVLWMVWLPAHMVKRRKNSVGKPEAAGGKARSRFDTAVLRFYQSAAWIVTIVCLIMTLNCLIFYHCTPLRDKDAQYDLEELIALRERIVTNCNRLSECMTRDARGKSYITAI